MRTVVARAPGKLLVTGEYAVLCSAPALVDLMAGQTQAMFDNTTSSLPQVRAGKLRALAVAEKTRLGAAPDTPTVAESGLPGFEASLEAVEKDSPVMVRVVRRVTPADKDKEKEKESALEKDAPVNGLEISFILVGVAPLK